MMENDKKDNKWYEQKSYEAIEKVLEQMKGKPFDQVKRAIKQCYPFGERKGKVYKIWNRIYKHSLMCIEKDLVKY